MTTCVAQKTLGEKARLLRRTFVVGALSILCALFSVRVAADQTLTLGLPQIRFAADQSTERDRAVVGAKLFNDKRLSRDGAISCASCHQSARAFTDGRPVAKGLGGRNGTRNTPSLLNVAFQTSFFWDGRRESLEAQATDPLTNPIEHGLKDLNVALTVIRNDPDYVAAITKAFSIPAGEIDISQMTAALTSYERTLVAGNSAFDQYRYGGVLNALTEGAKRGLQLFEGRAGCTGCHAIGPEVALFTDGKFHSVGVGIERIRSRLGRVATEIARMDGAALNSAVLMNPDFAELGRFVVTLVPADIGAFRTPSLRNVAVTSPYMHDGSVKTLAEAVEVEIYYRGSEMGRPLILTPQEKTDLVEFLGALTSPEFISMPR